MIRNDGKGVVKVYKRVTTEIFTERLKYDSIYRGNEKVSHENTGKKKYFKKKVQ